MHKAAINKASAKLERAQRAAQRMNDSMNQTDLETAWEDFIAAASTFYSALEQGAKANGKSQGWYGKKKHERRTDPLLSYIHHARNAEEHGIERITEHGSSSLRLKGRGAAVTLVDAAPGTWNVTEAAGDVEFANDRVRLVRVHDTRFKDWFDPPTQHLGHDLERGRSPVAVAELALAYLERMLLEAREL